VKTRTTIAHLFAGLSYRCRRNFLEPPRALPKSAYHAAAAAAAAAAEAMVAAVAAAMWAAVAAVMLAAAAAVAAVDGSGSLAMFDKHRALSRRVAACMASVHHYRYLSGAIVLC
jgi:hypothetical protein